MGLRIRLRGEREHGAGDAPAPQLSVVTSPEAPEPSHRWFVAVDGLQQGPYDAPDVRARLAAGHITPDTLVWHEGMSGWVPLAEVAELGDTP